MEVRIRRIDRSKHKVKQIFKDFGCLIYEILSKAWQMILSPGLYRIFACSIQLHNSCT